MSLLSAEENTVGFRRNQSEFILILPNGMGEAIGFKMRKFRYENEISVLSQIILVLRRDGTLNVVKMN